MSAVLWLVPMAFVGMLAVAVPILVHLLTRHERRPIEFPSLRFLSATRLIALRQRRLHDWLLLAIRAATVAAAVGALAAPLFVTTQRERTWAQRTSRAIVSIGGAEAPNDEREGAFRSRVIPADPRVADAVRSGVEWLAAQPPSARELLIVGDLREGEIDAADLAFVPVHVGIRFLPDATATPDSVVRHRVLSLRTEGQDFSLGQQAMETRRAHLNPENTAIERGAEPSASPEHRFEVRAAPEDQAVADAALAAVLEEGVVADAAEERHLIVTWSANAPSSTGTLSPWMRAALQRLQVNGHDQGGALSIDLPGRPNGIDAVDVLRRVATAVFDDPTTPREPRRVAAADLARWSRPAGDVPADAIRLDEGDRRFLWALVLALLALEWIVRRRGDRAETQAPTQEARVA